MASFDDDNDRDEDENENDNEDEDMEDVNEVDQDEDMDQGGDEDEDDGGDDDEDDNDANSDDGDEDDEQNDQDPDSPSRRTHTQRSGSEDRHNPNPAVVLTSPSPKTSSVRSPAGSGVVKTYLPPTRPEALTAQAYDIVPTMAAPQSTSINAITATPDMKWVFSGGTDGYVRMFNWVETANGKVPLTVAQKHPFVDSVMKAGSLVTYWENEESSLRTPSSNADEGKWTSPVYSLAVHHQALWLLSGLESGGINLQTCRHQAGTRITTLKDHTSAVSVLALSQDETQLLSGSWDKTILDWDLNVGKVKRSFKGAGSQIGAIETRPLSDVAVPEVSEIKAETFSTTFSSNNGDKPMLNGFSSGPSRRPSAMGGEEDAVGSPDGSLFGEGDHGSLFGDDTGVGGGGGAAFGDDDDDLTRALESEMQQTEVASGNADAEMEGVDNGGSVQPPVIAEEVEPISELTEAAGLAPGQDKTDEIADKSTEQQPASDPERPGTVATNGLPRSDEPLTAPPTNEEPKSELPAQSESTFLDAAIDGTLRIWDRRMAAPIATITPHLGTPPWCTGACWSSDGNFFYVGRRNCTVDEYSIHHLGSKRSEPNRNFKFQQGSGPVYALRAMPNKKHLVCASQDILRIYDLTQPESTKHSRVPFTIVPGHRGGVISAIYLDPTCRFMLSAAGNRGWEGHSTEVLLGYEIGIQDEKGVWHK